MLDDIHHGNPPVFGEGPQSKNTIGCGLRLTATAVIGPSTANDTGFFMVLCG